MEKLNPLKIYSLAIWYLVIPRAIARKINFRKTATESMTIGTAMSKIKYWRSFVRAHKMDKQLHFTYTE